jgi:hypothetical protein
MKRLVAMAMFLGLASGCGGRDSDATETLAPGTWGGQHWILEVAEDGTAHLEGDCSHARIDRPIEVGRGGSVAFDFGLAADPIVVHDPPLPEVVRPARLEARLEGETLRGRLRLAADDVPFEVVRGESGRLVKCL